MYVCVYVCACMHVYITAGPLREKRGPGKGRDRGPLRAKNLGYN